MPAYKLFSLPNCDKCNEAKDFLKSRNIEYQEFNLGMPAGKKEWGKILMSGYKPIKDEHGYVMPILVRMNGDSGIEAIMQGPEGIEVLFGT